MRASGAGCARARTIQVCQVTGQVSRDARATGATTVDVQVMCMCDVDDGYDDGRCRRCDDPR